MGHLPLANLPPKRTWGEPVMTPFREIFGVMMGLLSADFSTPHINGNSRILNWRAIFSGDIPLHRSEK